MTAQSAKKQGGWAVTLTGALIPISQPGFGIQPGVEYRFNQRTGLLAEITLRANPKNSRDSSELNKEYGRIKSELRFFLPGKNKKNQLYAGFQAGSSFRRFINQNSFYYDNRKTDSGYYYSKASINSPVTTFSLQLGTIISKKRFGVDFFTGAGVRFIQTRITKFENPVRSAIAKPTDGPSFTASYSYSGNIMMLHLTGGLRLIWHFYSSQNSKNP